MHEATLVASILRIAEEEARKHQAVRIISMQLEVGLLVCVEEATLCGCFEIFAEGSMGEGARLEIRRIPLACHCLQCGYEFMLEKRHFACIVCGAPEITFIGGHECHISAIELESQEKSHE